MAAGQKIFYGSSPLQYVDVYPCKAKKKNNGSCHLIIFIHGGAWYSGSTTDHEDMAEYISTNSNTAVALIDYRLCLKDNPEENKIHHPDHLNDVHSALELLFDSATGNQYNYNTSEAILVGHSVGGWMVLSAALASEANQEKASGPIANMPPLKASIRKAIRAFVAVESIFSIVGLVKLYPTYDSFVVPAFYLPNIKAKPPYSNLEKVGVEAWPLARNSSYFNSKQPRIYVIHSSEDDLLSADYNAEGVELLRGKGLSPIVDTTSFTGDHDHLLHTKAFWQRLIQIVNES